MSKYRKNSKSRKRKKKYSELSFEEKVQLFKKESKNNRYTLQNRNERQFNQNKKKNNNKEGDR